MSNENFILKNSGYLIELSTLTDSIYELSSRGVIGRATELKLLEIAHRERIYKENKFEKNPFQSKVLVKIRNENYLYLKSEIEPNLYDVLDSIILLSECLKFSYMRIETEKTNFNQIVTVNSKDERMIEFIVNKIDRFLIAIDKFRDVLIKLSNCVTAADMLTYIEKQGLK